MVANPNKTNHLLRMATRSLNRWNTPSGTISCWWLEHKRSQTIYKGYLVPQTTNLKWMFGETTISYVKIGNHPIETTIYKWLFGVPGNSIYLTRPWPGPTNRDRSSVALVSQPEVLSTELWVFERRQLQHRRGGKHQTAWPFFSCWALGVGWVGDAGCYSTTGSLGEKTDLFDFFCVFWCILVLEKIFEKTDPFDCIWYKGIFAKNCDWEGVLMRSWDLKKLKLRASRNAI